MQAQTQYSPEQKVAGWDYTGCIGKPSMTSLQMLYMVKHGDKKGRELWKQDLAKFGHDYSKTAAEFGEDMALAAFFAGLKVHGVTQGDYAETAARLLKGGHLREGVLNGMYVISKNIPNVMVTKNFAEEAGHMAGAINDVYGAIVVDKVVGSKGLYSGDKLVGVREIMADQQGTIDRVPTLYDSKGNPLSKTEQGQSEQELVGIGRTLKKDAFANEAGGNLIGFVSDSRDKDAALKAKENGGASILIINTLPKSQLDPYFQVTADETGNYQKKVMAGDEWTHQIKDTEDLEKRLSTLILSIAA
jgi:hypothetical protein